MHHEKIAPITMIIFQTVITLKNPPPPPQLKNNNDKQL